MTPRCADTRETRMEVAMVYHVGEHTEEVRFCGGPLDGSSKFFNPQMMSTVYRHKRPGEEDWYRLRRIANPARKGRGYIDLIYVHEDESS